MATETLTPEERETDLATENEQLRKAGCKAYNALYNLRQLHDFAEHDDSVKRLIAELGELTAERKRITPPRTELSYGFAPGMYLCKCVRCGEQFQGDKRARRCQPCAKFLVESATPPTD